MLHLRHLKFLHIRRSLEPYGDTMPVTKLSHAHFSNAAMAHVWSVLSSRTALCTLKITIGRLAHWDELDVTMIAPSGQSRTFVAQRKSFAQVASVSSRPAISYLEGLEAIAAHRQHRPGPLLDYWQKQVEISAQFVEEANEAVFPDQYLIDGIETDRRINTRHYYLSLPVSESERRLVLEAFQNALHLQHDREQAEVMHPTRQFY